MIHEDTPQYDDSQSTDRVNVLSGSSATVHANTGHLIAYKRRLVNQRVIAPNKLCFVLDLPRADSTVLWATFRKVLAVQCPHLTLTRGTSTRQIQKYDPPHCQVRLFPPCIATVKRLQRF
jgi:hypothetical protein